MADAEESRLITLFGKDFEVIDVPIVSAREEFNTYELGDGSEVQVKSVATSFVKMKDQMSADGRPLYLVNVAPSVRVVRWAEPSSKPRSSKPRSSRKRRA